MRCIFFLAFLLTSVILLIPSLPRSSGCASVPKDKEHVRVNAEEAIIVYDAATQTEHFIRRADFRTRATNFGFLVPTPTQPELGETDSKVFGMLHRVTAPRHEFSGNVQRIVQKRSPRTEAPSRTANEKSAPQVLDRKTVAGFDAVVLRADNTEGLKKWLEDNQYNARPAVMDWLKWYVENKWIITAFKVSLDGSAERRWANSVRMSFQTDRPFYPYREPEDMRARDTQAHQRKLRIYFLADARYGGSLGRDGAWGGRTVWSNICPTGPRKVKGLEMPAIESEIFAEKIWHLTEFEDDSSPRPGTDEVYFGRANDQATVERPVIYYDRYEYVYEDEIPTTRDKPKTGADRFPVGDNKQWYVGLILGGVAVIVAAIVILVLRKK